MLLPRSFNCVVMSVSLLASLQGRAGPYEACRIEFQGAFAAEFNQEIFLREMVYVAQQRGYKISAPDEVRRKSGVFLDYLHRGSIYPTLRERLDAYRFTIIDFSRRTRLDKALIAETLIRTVALGPGILLIPMRDVAAFLAIVDNHLTNPNWPVQIDEMIAHQTSHHFYEARGMLDEDFLDQILRRHKNGLPLYQVISKTAEARSLGKISQSAVDLLFVTLRRYQHSINENALIYEHRERLQAEVIARRVSLARMVAEHVFVSRLAKPMDEQARQFIENNLKMSFIISEEEKFLGLNVQRFEQSMDDNELQVLRRLGVLGVKVVALGDEVVRWTLGVNVHIPSVDAVLFQAARQEIWVSEIKSSLNADTLVHARKQLIATYRYVRAIRPWLGVKKRMVIVVKNGFLGQDDEGRYILRGELRVNSRTGQLFQLNKNGSLEAVLEDEEPIYVLSVTGPLLNVFFDEIKPERIDP